MPLPAGTLWARLAAGICCLLLVGLLPQAATPVWAAPARAETCTGVWVIVDTGVDAGASKRCATTYETGADALQSAGYAARLQGGMVAQIDSFPADGQIRNDHYWSYWHAKRGAGGEYGEWEYSNLGAGAYNPEPGDAEGWRFITVDQPPDQLPRPAAPPAGSPESQPTPGQTTSVPVTGAPASGSDSATAPIWLIGTAAVLAVGVVALVWWTRRKGRFS